MLGFIVQSYMAAQLPGTDQNRPGLTTARPGGGAGGGGGGGGAGAGDPLSSSIRSQADKGEGAGGGGRGGAECDPLSSSRRSYRDRGSFLGFGVGAGAGVGASDPLSSSRRSRGDGREGAAASASEATSLLGSSGKGAVKNGAGSSKDGTR